MIDGLCSLPYRPVRTKGIRHVPLYMEHRIQLEPCLNKIVEGLVLKMINGNQTIEMASAVSGVTNQTHAEGCSCIDGSSCTKRVQL